MQTSAERHEADLDRMFDFFVERELARDGGDLYLPEQAMVALRAGIATLKSSPRSRHLGVTMWRHDVANNATA